MNKKFITFISLLLVFSLCGCSSLDAVTNDVIDQTSNIIQQEDEYVVAVQNAVVTGHSCTYKEAFDSFFAYPTWKHFTSDENKDVVEFTGSCTYDNANVKAKIQFLITSEQENYIQFEASYLSFNDVSQNLLMLSALIEKAVCQCQDDILAQQGENDGLDEVEETQDEPEDNSYLNELKNEISELDSEIDGCYWQIDRQKEIILDYETKIQENRNLLVEHEKTISQLQNSTDDYERSQIQRYNQYAENYRREIERIPNLINYSNDLINGWNEKILEIEAEKEELIKKLNDAEI
ncbi:MAG: hypothetical protein Q4C12_03510 [Clostridia bacterium]|nr:hypothetical protein [Clostridia bacterium]